MTSQHNHAGGGFPAGIFLDMLDNFANAAAQQQDKQPVTPKQAQRPENTSLFSLLFPNVVFETSAAETTETPQDARAKAEASGHPSTFRKAAERPAAPAEKDSAAATAGVVLPTEYLTDDKGGIALRIHGLGASAPDFDIELQDANKIVVTVKERNQRLSGWAVHPDYPVEVAADNISRTYQLPEDLIYTTEDVSAQFANGALVITIRPSQTVKNAKVKIKVG